MDGEFSGGKQKTSSQSKYTDTFATLYLVLCLAFSLEPSWMSIYTVSHNWAMGLTN